MFFEKYSPKFDVVVQFSTVDSPVHSLHIHLIYNFSFLVIHCVKITKITIPEYYVIEDSEKPDTLVLDCEYELQRSEENGLVIKWTFEGEIIYQWIPHHKPHVLRVRFLIL